MLLAACIACLFDLYGPNFVLLLPDHRSSDAVVKVQPMAQIQLHLSKLCVAF